MLSEDGRRRHDVRPEVKHHQANEGEEGDEDEDIKVPVELKMEFLRAVIKRDLKLACKLCQMILIYEPENPEASNFLPLIKKKLLEEQKAKQSSEEDDDDDDSDDSGSDEESSHSSSGSSSSCSSSPPSDDDDDDDREEKQVHRHKRCPSENDT
ncbi:glutamate-rich protein 2 [Labrus mixtus]|uniref:glutamate-rich protein 2 n=1 Tax=Labrus mixtus TaxID=508554 RepID=UPI0029BFD2FE|nr:glutamate-rich protein 2 [Labrus mixtus]